MSEESSIMGVSLLALVSAGQIKEDDGTLAIMQGVELSTANSIADWLVLATGGPVKLQWTTIGRLEEIERTPEQVSAKIKPA